MKWNDPPFTPEPRFLWPHFQQQFVEGLAPFVNGVFHY